MFALSKVVLLFFFVVYANARAAPHARGWNHHHALAARMAAPAPVSLPLEARVVKPRNSKRQNSNRCRARTSTSAEPEPTSVPLAVVNPAPAPSTTTSPPPPPTTSEPPPPPPPPPPPQPSPPAIDNNNNSGNNGGNNNDGGNSGGGNNNGGGSNNGGGVDLPSFMFGTQSGQGTFYAIGLGACGRVNGGDDRIAAVSHKLFDNYPGYDRANPNNNPICGRRVNVQFEGKSTSCTIVDRCEGCDEMDLDFSPRAFEDIAAFARGRISPIRWQWAD